MNCLHRICAVVIFCSLVQCANAQPLETEPLAAQRYVQPPEGAVGWLVYAFNRQGDVRGRAARVVGANPDDPALAEVEAEIKRARGTFLLSVSDFQAQVNGAEATITFKSTLRDNLLNEITQTEHLQLHQVETQWETHWDVVPGKPEEVANDKNSGILLKLATFMAHPQEMLDISRAATSRSNVEQLTRGILLGIVQDYDERFELKAESFKEKLAPYVQSEQLFFAPADKSGAVSYAFNSKLSGIHLHAAAKPSQTILLYEGKDGQLAFRYENKAIVSFVDGTVRMVTPEEAKSLLWEP